MNIDYSSLEFILFAYALIGWIVGVVAFGLNFVSKKISMGGNSGVSMIRWYEMELPNNFQCFELLLWWALWPFYLGVAVVALVANFSARIISKHKIIPRIVRFVFGWPFLLYSFFSDRAVEFNDEA